MRTFCFLLLLIRWCFAHYLFSTFTNTLAFCALFVFYFHYYVGVLRTICFLVSVNVTLACCALFVFYFNYDVGVLRTICLLLSLLRWCFLHNLFSTLTNTWVFCALFVFYFNYYVGVLCTICFLISLTIMLAYCALVVFYLF